LDDPGTGLVNSQSVIWDLWLRLAAGLRGGLARTTPSPRRIEIVSVARGIAEAQSVMM
jgi:hypothetical protein